jgi:hypothetical protein
VLEQVGGYNELFRYSQDHDLWLRIAKTHRIAILPDPLYGVRRHDSRVTLTKMKQARLFRMLAVNLARDKVPPEILDRIRTEGIDLYYEFLSRRERIEFHTALKKKSLRYRCPTEAQEHSRELVRLCPYRLVERLQLGLMSQRRSPRP